MKITADLIEKINERYCEIKNKSQIAREIGCSPSTISKYIIEGYVKKANIKPKELTKEQIEIMEKYICPAQMLIYNRALCLTEQEKKELKEFKENEVSI